MECRTFDERISFYIDNQLNEVEHKEFELHLMKCENCRESYEDMLEILVELKKDEAVDLPDNYRSELRDKLREASKENRRRISWKHLSAMAASLIILIVSIGLISNNDIMAPEEGLMNQMDKSAPQMEMFSANEAVEDQNEAVVKDEAIYEEEENFQIVAFEKSIDENDAMVKAQMDRSVVSRNGVSGIRNLKEAYIDIQIVEYDNTISGIESFVKANNGFIENSQIGFSPSDNSQEKVKLKEGNVRIRVPQDRFEDTVNFLRNLGVTMNEQIYEVDISQDYFSTEHNVKNLEIQEERLEEILGEVEEVEDILQVENELKRVRTEIDTGRESLKNLNDSSNMTTITANIREVEDSKGVPRLVLLITMAALAIISLGLVIVWRKRIS